MLGNYQIAPAPTKQAAGEYKNMYQSMTGYRNQIMSIRNQLDGSSYADVKIALATMADDVNSQIEALKDLEHILYDIVRYYENAEKTILGEKKGLLERIEDAFKNDFLSTYATDLFNSFLESSGGFLVKIGGEINIVTAVAASSGENAFVIVNPSVAEVTSKVINGGKWLSTGAKYGLPIIGGLIDFGSQLLDGEDVKDAAAKAGAHVVIGAVVGALVGSIIPGAGTVAGAAAGIAISTAVTMAVSELFDYVYDNWDDISDSVKHGWDDITDKAGKALDNIGDAFCGFAGNLGTIFG